MIKIFNIHQFFQLIFAILILQACTSGKKAYEQGDYYSSVLKSVERLRKNPGHKKSREVLRQSYPQAVNYYTNTVNQYQSSGNPRKNELILDCYVRLNQMYNEINRSPGALKVIPNPQSFTSEERRYRELAAEELYDAGVKALAFDTRESAKEAYFKFSGADRILPNYRDVRKQMEEAKYMATLRVVVEQVPVPTWNSQVSVNFFQEKLNSYFFSYGKNEFVRFYSPEDPNLPEPDQVVVVQFEDFVVGQTKYFESSKELNRDSVVVGTVKLENGKNADVYGTVKATYTEMRREVISKGMVSMRVIDHYSKAVLINERFPGEFKWISNWATFKGDERALDKEQLKRSELKAAMPPPPQDLFIEFTKPIFSQITTFSDRYYRQF